MATWAPDAGDIVWMQFDPQVGHEQAGHRPALVLTSQHYNQKRGMLVCCPMTSRIKGYVFEVIVSRDPPSVVLTDQIRSLDWRAREATRKGRVSPAVLAAVQARIKTLIGL